MAWVLRFSVFENRRSPIFNLRRIGFFEEGGSSKQSTFRRTVVLRRWRVENGSGSSNNGVSSKIRNYSKTGWYSSKMGRFFEDDTHDDTITQRTSCLIARNTIIR